jgi:Mce-associated membrane protein
VEDQPADAGDLNTSEPATPVRRGGRHRWFRPRPPSTPAASDADKPATAEESPVLKTTEAKTSAEPSTQPAETAAPPEAVPEQPDAPDEASTEQPDAPDEASTEQPDAPDEASTEQSTAPAAAARPGGLRRLFARRSKPATTDAVTEGAADGTGEELPTEVVDETATAAPKPVGRVLAAAVAAAAVLFVGAGAFAGAMLQPYLADKALVNTKLEIARTATGAITTLWTYTPDNMDSLPNRSAKYLAGDFQDQYRKYIDAIVPVNKQAKVSNSTQVVGAAVESLQGKDATAVVYTNTTNTSPQSNNIPSLRYLSYRLTMQRHGSQWLITKMTTITSLDLTPKLG